MHCGSLQCLLIIYVKQTICGALHLTILLGVIYLFFIFDYGSLHIACCCVIKIIRHVVDESVHFQHQNNCDPLCEIQAKVSKSNYEKTSINILFIPLIPL